MPGNANKYRDDVKHGYVNMRQAISRSCDVYFYRVAWKLGITRMDEFMKTFGYGELTGIDIPGEKSGLYGSPEWKRHAFKCPADQVWFAGESISMEIGQGPITVTPLQQAHIAAEIAERGKIIAAPRLVSGTRAAGSNTVVARETVLKTPIDIATSEQWDVVYDGMLGATSMPGGTAYQYFQKSRYKVAGKTGTAQVFTIKQTETTRFKNHRRAQARSRLVHRLCADGGSQDRRCRARRKRRLRGCDRRADRAEGAGCLPAGRRGADRLQGGGAKANALGNETIGNGATGDVGRLDRLARLR